MAAVILGVIQARIPTFDWAHSPTAALGYFSGVQDPGGSTGDGLFTVNGVPTKGWVHIIHSYSGKTVAKTFAAEDGTWYVGWIPSEDLYDIKGRDVTGTYNDVIANEQAPYV